MKTHVKNRRHFLNSMGIGMSALVIPGLLQAEESSGKKPNILFLFTDDQRHDTIHALGNEQIKTPNLDSLANSGTAFTKAYYMGASKVAGVCMPSRAMLHSGRSLFHIEKQGQSIPKEHIILGQALGQNGYRTFGTGKWHNGTESFNRSFKEGTEIFFDCFFFFDLTIIPLRRR